MTRQLESPAAGTRACLGWGPRDRGTPTGHGLEVPDTGWPISKAGVANGFGQCGAGPLGRRGTGVVARDQFGECQETRLRPARISHLVGSLLVALFTGTWAVRSG